MAGAPMQSFPIMGRSTRNSGFLSDILGMAQDKRSQQNQEFKHARSVMERVSMTLENRADAVRRGEEHPRSYMGLVQGLFTTPSILATFDVGGWEGGSANAMEHYQPDNMLGELSTPRGWNQMRIKDKELDNAFLRGTAEDTTDTKVAIYNSEKPLRELKDKETLTKQQAMFEFTSTKQSAAAMAKAKQYYESGYTTYQGEILKRGSSANPGTDSLAKYLGSKTSDSRDSNKPSFQRWLSSYHEAGDPSRIVATGAEGKKVSERQARDMEREAFQTWAQRIIKAKGVENLSKEEREEIYGLLGMLEEGKVNGGQASIYYYLLKDTMNMDAKALIAETEEKEFGFWDYMFKSRKHWPKK